MSQSQFTPPTEGEVARLRRLAPQNPLGIAVPTILRAAYLLEQRPPAPVPVSERLPGAEDRNKNGECWWFNQAGVAEWQLSSGGPYGDFWLPFHALPLPAGEVEE